MKEQSFNTRLADILKPSVLFQLHEKASAISRVRLLQLQINPIWVILFHAQIIEADAPHIAIKLQIVTDWGMRTLATFHPLAYRTGNANRLRAQIFSTFKMISIDKITRMMHFTAKRNGKFGG